MPSPPAAAAAAAAALAAALLTALLLVLLALRRRRRGAAPPRATFVPVPLPLCSAETLRGAGGFRDRGPPAAPGARGEAGTKALPTSDSVGRVAVGRGAATPEVASAPNAVTGVGGGALVRALLSDAAAPPEGAGGRPWNRGAALAALAAFELPPARAGERLVPAGEKPAGPFAALPSRPYGRPPAALNDATALRGGAAPPAHEALTDGGFLRGA